MKAASKIAPPGNVYVNLDCRVPASLKLSVGHNLVILRNLSAAGGKLLRCVQMPSPCFVSATVPYGTTFPGQPQDTYVVALGLVAVCGTGEIVIQFCKSAEPCSVPRSIRIGFSITDSSPKL
ncbi:MAG: hypothetical protein K2X27_11935 [Candidatus Obscuribacterales bacterium]|nr:hypothetical protein [Candidatus Obscuribacterales bacterium]